MDTIEKEIEKSRYIYKLKDDWDDNGSVGYKKVDWQVTIDFLTDFLTWISENTDCDIQIPKIHHASRGSFDLLWEENETKIYYNIDPINNLGTFYSYSSNQNSRGEFTLNNIDYSVLPLPIKRRRI